MEESLQDYLAKAIQEMENEKKILNNLKEERERGVEEAKIEASSGVTVEKLRNYNSYISFVKQKISNQTEKVKCSKETADKYREELVAAVKERKMLETLKEKQYSQYLKEEEKKQQRIVDEIVSYKESTSKKINGGQNGRKSKHKSK